MAIITLCFHLKFSTIRSRVSNFLYSPNHECVNLIKSPILTTLSATCCAPRFGRQKGSTLGATLKRSLVCTRLKMVVILTLNALHRGQVINSLTKEVSSNVPKRGRLRRCISTPSPMIFFNSIYCVPHISKLTLCRKNTIICYSFYHGYYQHALTNYSVSRLYCLL